MSNILKVNRKDTRRVPGVAIVNFKPNSPFIQLPILLNLKK